MSRKRQLLLAAPVVFAWLCAGQPAKADGAGAAQIPTQRTTEIDLNSQILYDSNIIRLRQAPPGLRLADEMATPDLSVVIARPIGPLMLFLRGDGGYDFHRFNTIRDHAHVQINGGAGRRIGECDGSLTGLFGQNQSDLAEVSLASASGQQVSSILKNVETQENVAFTGRCGRSVGLAPSISVTQSWLSNSSVYRRGVDNESLSLNAGLGYQQPAFGVVSVFGVYNSSTYPNRSVLSGGGVSGYQVFAGGLRYERHIGPRLDALASVSYTSLTPNDQAPSAGSPAAAPSISKFSGLTYSLDVSYHLTPRLLLHVNGGKATTPSNRVDAAFSVNDNYQGDITYQMGRRFLLKLVVDNKQESYRGVSPTSPIQAFNLLKGSITEVVGSVTYNLNRRLSLGLNVGDAERRATPSAFNFSSTTAGLTLRATF